MESSPAPKPGITLAGRYRLGRHLGEGRSGHVFQARDKESGEKVAIKLLHHRLCSVEREVRRFAREFELTRQIDHPNVVGMRAFGQETEGELEGTHYLVLELLKGKGLDEVVADGALPPSRACGIAIQVARALAAAHEHDVVHRDLKPGNIILERRKDGEHVRVLDFGLARLEGGLGEDLTGVGVRLGSAAYMSPEYIEEGDLDARSDLYSLGVLLYEMLTGRPPFVGRMMTVMQDHVESPVPPPSKRASGLPSWLEDLVLRLLAKDPSQRPASAMDVVRRLEAELPQLAATADEERRALANSTLDMMHAPPPASVGAQTELTDPIYRDPKPLPGIPVALGVALIGFGVLGVGGILGIFVVLVFG